MTLHRIALHYITSYYITYTHTYVYIYIFLTINNIETVDLKCIFSWVSMVPGALARAMDKTWAYLGWLVGEATNHPPVITIKRWYGYHSQSWLVKMALFYPPNGDSYYGILWQRTSSCESLALECSKILSGKPA